MKTSVYGITIDRAKRPSKVQQHMKNSCDINQIMQKAREGIMPQIASGVAQYLDVSDVPDYQTALGIVNAGNDAFMSLPAKIRQKFGNSPVTFIQALEDASRKEELVEMGILEKPVKEAVMEEKKGEPAKAGA